MLKLHVTHTRLYAGTLNIELFSDFRQEPAEDSLKNKSKVSVHLHLKETTKPQSQVII